jgi:pyruvate carboxylase
MFLVTRGIKPADVVNLEPGSAPFPESVIDMLSGGLGQPTGGWPKRIQEVVLGKRKPLRGRPGAGLPPLNLKKAKDDLLPKLKREATDDDLYSHLMYPEVFAEYVRFARDFGRVSALPTPAFFYAVKPGEEISVNIEEGKTLFVRLINVGAPDLDGMRNVTFELNGMARESSVLDRSIQTKVKTRAKADPADPLQIGAPIPGIITSLAVSVGTKVTKGDRILTLEAMKMQTTLYAQVDGVVDALHAQVGDTVESKTLLVRLRP